MVHCDLPDPELILAAEEFSDDDFRNFHSFFDYEDRIIRKLIAHGPILLRGGRGSGKSALLKEASIRINKGNSTEAFAIYVSLRYLPLLRYTEREYERYLCKLLNDQIKRVLRINYPLVNFDSENSVGDLQMELTELSLQINRRIVILFDDAAHIGRGTSLKDFFDIFRTLSSNSISCKAAIYPGVTEFGSRFDVLNDASVIDIARSEEASSFGPFFTDVIKKRYKNRLPLSVFKNLSQEDVATFLGRAVTGNVRAFIFACNDLAEDIGEKNIGLPDIEATIKHLAADYYWPLLDEVEPKLGPYEPLVSPARDLAEKLFTIVKDAMMANPSYGPSCLVHRDHIERLKKLFEILEYAGFIVKREASRALKSGGRGARYALNLCNLIEIFSPSRLTAEMFKNWMMHDREFAQIYKGGELDSITLPQVDPNKDLSILDKPIEILKRSKAYPYGLTEHRIDSLLQHGFITVGQLADASNEEILSVDEIGVAWLERIRNVVGQAVWM